MLADAKNARRGGPERPVVQDACRAVEAVESEPAARHGVGGRGDTASFEQQMSTVSFGPGREPIELPNEYRDREIIRVAARVCVFTAELALDVR